MLKRNPHDFEKSVQKQIHIYDNSVKGEFRVEVGLLYHIIKNVSQQKYKRHIFLLRNQNNLT